MKKLFTAAALVGLSAAASAQGTVNVICSVQAEWCNVIATVYARTTGTRINMSLKGSGEALAQLIAEKDNPKTDIWFGGTGDPHLQAAEQGLTLEYKSPTLAHLHPWAQQQARQSNWRTVGIYSGPLASATTPSCWRARSCPFPGPGATCSSPNTRARCRWPTPRPAAPRTP